MTTTNTARAIVIGASSVVRSELAPCCARGGFDRLIVAAEPHVHTAPGTAGY